MIGTSPEQLRDQLEKYWQRGDLLRARLDGETLFPLALRLRKPGARDLAERFADVADWVQALRDGSKARKTFGYTVHWRQRRHRIHGTNALPDAITVDTEEDALRWLSRRAEAARFSRLADSTLARFPALHGWLCRRPLRALQHEQDWNEILAVLGWFQAHPRPGLYLRELDIPGVHTKFIEARRGLLAELLDAALPPETIDTDASGVRGFQRRYGLKEKPVLVRLRVLDEKLAIRGLTDLTVPVAQLASLDPGADTVFITENEINGLAFPPFPGALVIFGSGYRVEVLRHLPWLTNKRLYYWGDIDTHGFAILNRFRQWFPQARSLLMDQATLEAHRPAWGRESDDKRFSGTLERLTEAESDLFAMLDDDRLAPALRLEQEHIAQSWLLAGLSRL